MSCQSCSNYIEPLQLCSLGLDITSSSCSQYYEGFLSSASIIELIKIMGRDDTFYKVPRWVRGFLGKNYLIGSLEGWVIFEEPPHILSILKYKRQIIGKKSIIIYRLKDRGYSYENKSYIAVSINEFLPRLFSQSSVLCSPILL